MKDILLVLAAAVVGLVGLSGTTPHRELGNTVDQEWPFVVRVPRDFPTIQQAVDAVAEGGTVLIEPGTYQENVRITKSVRLVGSSQELVRIQLIEHGGVTLDIQADRPIQVYLADITLENKGFLNSTGIRFTGDSYAIIERLTVTGYENGIRIRNLSSVLSAVTASRNVTGIIVERGTVLIRDSIITDNREGIAAWLVSREGQDYLTVERSLLSGNVGIALLLIGGIFGGPAATLAENRIVKNLGGVYLGYDRDYNWTQLLFTRFRQPEPGPRVITVYKNQIMENLIYGLALVDREKCPEIKEIRGDPGLLLLQVSPGGTAFIGMENEIRANGKADLCPADYPWPPGFRKP